MTDEQLEQESEHLRKIGEGLGVERSVWCVPYSSESDYWTNPLAKGVYTFKNGRKSYKLVNPTYADIWVAFEKSLEDIGPDDHIFIEDVSFNGDKIEIFAGS